VIPERVLKALALLAGVMTVAMAIVGALLRLLGPATPQTFNIGSPIDFLAEAASASTYAVIGVLLSRRLPRHPVPWIFLGIGLAFAGVVVTWAYAVVALSRVPELGGARLGVLLDTAIMQPVGLALLVALLVLFPDGRVIDRASRRILQIVPITAGIAALGVALTPGDIGIFTGLLNPLHLDVSPTLGRALTILGVGSTVILAAMGVMSLFRRYRAADKVQREQIRWFVWAGGLAVALAGGILVLLAVDPDILNTPAEAIVLVGFSFGGAVVPIACAIAIRRYHLYDIDRLISQTVVYGSLVAIVAGVYAALIGTFEQLSITFTGQGSNASLVLTSVILAITFEPLKKRLEAYVERFREKREPEPVAVAMPVPDNAWIEAVAVRVAEILRAEGRAPE
jgi:hypothetical protein